MIQKEKIEKILEEYFLKRSDLFLVEIKISRDNDIEIVVEIDRGFLSLEECVNISRFVESKLDREVEDFSLTVGSAGLSRSFKVLRQYHKAVGSEIELKLKSGESLKGMLKAVSEEGITFVTKVSEKVEGRNKKVTREVVEEYAFDRIKSAKPVIKFDDYKNR